MYLRVGLVILAAIVGLVVGEGEKVERDEAPTLVKFEGDKRNTDEERVRKQTEVLEVGSGWQFFNVKPGHANYAKLALVSDVDVIIELTDAFCSGDIYDVYVGDRYGVTTSFVNDTQCRAYTDDPYVAFASPSFSHATFQLNAPINTTLNILANKAPYGASGGFIRADRRLERCLLYDPPFQIPMGESTTWSMASDLCWRLNGTVATVGHEETHKAAYTVTTCLTPGLQVWIAGNAISGNNQPSNPHRPAKCPSLRATSTTAGVIEYIPCNSMLSVLCQGSFKY